MAPLMLFYRSRLNQGFSLGVCVYCYFHGHCGWLCQCWVFSMSFVRPAWQNPAETEERPQNNVLSGSFSEQCELCSGQRDSCLIQTPKRNSWGGAHAVFVCGCWSMDRLMFSLHYTMKHMFTRTYVGCSLHLEVWDLEFVSRSCWK